MLEHFVKLIRRISEPSPQSSRDEVLTEDLFDPDTLPFVPRSWVYSPMLVRDESEPEESAREPANSPESRARTPNGADRAKVVQFVPRNRSDPDPPSANNDDDDPGSPAA